MKRKIKNQTKEEEVPDGHAHKYLLVSSLEEYDQCLQKEQKQSHREINLEVVKQISNRHPTRENPTRTERIFRNHVVKMSLEMLTLMHFIRQ